MELGAGPAPATWQHPRIVSVMDAWQRDFPCVPEPFAVLARHHGYEVEALLHDLHEAQTHRVLGRIGGVFAPNTVGASTLAAVAVPPEDIARAAAIVNRHPEVNHNYEREHAFNLWFVAAADHAARLREVLDTIGEELGVPVHDFPLEAEYHIDLGFSLQDGSRAPHRIRPQPRGALSTDQRRLMTLLGQGLALVEHPYADWAHRLGWTEAGVLAQLRWEQAGRVQCSTVLAPQGSFARMMQVMRYLCENSIGPEQWLEVLEDVHQPYRLLPEAQQPADIHPESGCFCGIC